MATIREVAKRAGVSIATVSRILNQDESYKTTEETKQKVWKAVNELNYVPSNTGKNQSKKNKKLEPSGAKIGCIISVSEEKYSDPYFMSIVSGVEAQLNKNGYNLSLIRSYKELEDRKILSSTLNESLTGLIVMATLQPEIYGKIKENVPFLVGIDTEDSTIDNIGYDRFHAAEQAVKYLLEKGHRRIGYIGAETNSNQDFIREDRCRGYINTLRDANIDIDMSIIKDCQWKRSVCYEKTLELLELENPPTAIFAASDPMAAIALAAIYKKGLRVPDDIAVIGISNIEMSRYTSPPLTTIDVPKLEIGKTAADVLIARINGDDSLPKKIILPTSLIERSSV